MKRLSISLKKNADISAFLTISSYKPVFVFQTIIYLCIYTSLSPFYSFDKIPLPNLSFLLEEFTSFHPVISNSHCFCGTLEAIHPSYP